MDKPAYTWDEHGKLVPLDEERRRAQVDAATEEFHRINAEFPEPKLGMSRDQKKHTQGWSLHRFLSETFPAIKWPWID